MSFFFYHGKHTGILTFVIAYFYTPHMHLQENIYLIIHTLSIRKLVGIFGMSGRHIGGRVRIPAQIWAILSKYGEYYLIVWTVVEQLKSKEATQHFHPGAFTQW